VSSLRSIAIRTLGETREMHYGVVRRPASEPFLAQSAATPAQSFNLTGAWEDQRSPDRAGASNG
jgi:hypothetical protein